MPFQDGIYYTQFEGSQSYPILVLIHGAGSNRLCWHPELRRLIGYQVITLDLPGHGRSDSSTGCHSINSYAKQVVEFLNSLGLYHVILIGHSMGGAIALEIAQKYPHLITGVVLIACSAYFGIAQEIVDLLRVPATLPDAIQFIQHRGFSPNTPSSIIRQTMKVLIETRPTVLYGDWFACAGFDKRQDLSEINTPVWVGVGADDKLTPPENSRYLVKHLPMADLHIIPQAGHMIILEQPYTLNEQLLQFITKFRRLEIQ